MVVGVGIGGTFEKMRASGEIGSDPETVEGDTQKISLCAGTLRIEMLEKINELGIGPGLGGTTTALAVFINTYPHISSDSLAGQISAAT